MVSSQWLGGAGLLATAVVADCQREAWRLRARDNGAVILINMFASVRLCSPIYFLGSDLVVR